MKLCRNYIEIIEDIVKVCLVIFSFFELIIKYYVSKCYFIFI